MMRKLLASIALLGLVLVGSPANSAVAAAPKVGSACTKLNQVVIANNVKYQCAKSGSKKVWKRIGVVAVPSPKPTATPTPTPSGPVFNQSAADINNCKLPQASSRDDVMTGWPRNPARQKSQGKVVYEVIFADFSDAPSKLSPEAVFAKISPKSEQEFLESSGGRFQLNYVPVMKWMRMPSASSAYSYSNFDGHRRFIQDAVSAADSLVDFSKVDGVVVLTDPTTSPFANGPAFTARRGIGVVADGVEILNGITSGRDLDFWGARWANHEMTHNLGLPDLYAYSGDAHRFVGGFSYMGLINGQAPGLTGWERFDIGWIADSEILCDPAVGQQFKVGPLSGASTRLAIVKINQFKALVLEVRTRAGIDTGVTTPGVLAYTVDTRIASGEGTITVVSKKAVAFPLPSNSLRGVGDTVTVDGRSVEIFWNSGEQFGFRVVK